MNRVFAVAVGLFFLLVGCVHGPEYAGYGLQPGEGSFVPARIAVLKCRVWPSGARFATLPLTNLKKEQLAQLCSAFDRFVVEGFEGEPYMRGLNPNTVERVAKKKLGDGFFREIDQAWSNQSDDCNDCPNPPSFYSQSLAHREPWLSWLDQLGRVTKDADAALLPMVTFYQDLNYYDRGYERHELHAGVTLLLVDTNNGNLLWAGGRQAKSRNHLQESILPVKPLEVQKADPQLLRRRLFVDQLWQEFPGRQTFH